MRQTRNPGPRGLPDQTLPALTPLTRRRMRAFSILLRSGLMFPVGKSNAASPSFLGFWPPCRLLRLRAIGNLRQSSGEPRGKITVKIPKRFVYPVVTGRARSFLQLQTAAGTRIAGRMGLQAARVPAAGSDSRFERLNIQEYIGQFRHRQEL